MDQGRSKWALDGIKERWIREQAMDQRVQESKDRSIREQAIDGRSDGCHNRWIGEQAMDQGAREWAIDVTSGEIEGAMDKWASYSDHNIFKFKIIYVYKWHCWK